MQISIIEFLQNCHTVSSLFEKNFLQNLNLEILENNNFLCTKNFESLNDKFLLYGHSPYLLFI